MALQRLQENRERAATAQAEQEEGNDEVEVLPKRLQMKAWTDTMRGISKDLTRSALFQVADMKTPRVMYDKQPIATIQNMRITYTGQELRQEDLDVFMQLCHMAKDDDLETVLTVIGNDALDGLGWPREGACYERLRQSYWRLLTGTVIVERYIERAGKRGNTWRPVYGAHLIHTIDVVDDSSPSLPWNIYLNTKIAGLMAGDAVTLIDYMMRARLNPLARWLHAFYATHEKPYALKVATLREYTGSRQKSLPSFRQQLRKALDSLVEVGFIASWQLGEGDLVSVQRTNGGQKSLPFTGGT
jgi:hypothetical protein